MTFRRILIAVDESPVASYAAEVGLELSRALQGELALVHVQTAPVSYGTETGVPPSELMALAKTEGRTLLARIRERLSLPDSAQQFLLAGVPATEIVEAARGWAAEVIVIGSHGRGGMRRALLGSVAEAVMRQAHCPVLVVRGKD